jgi:DNA-binding transcriptional LysR family regulator
MSDTERVERRLKLHDLRVLMAVVQTGSMGKAAERLRTSQPAISRSIAVLEHALGVRLLDRSSHGVEPTSYGRALVTRGIAVFDELGQGIKDIEFLADPTAGEVRVGASVAVAVSFVSAVIDRLSRQYPRLTFRVLATDSGAAYRALAERNVDLAVLHIAGPAVEEHLDAEILYDEPHVVAASVQNPWTRRRRIELADLINEPWTLPPPDTLFGSVVTEAFRASGLDVPRTAVISSLPVRNALLATGRFLTMVTRVVLEFPTRNLELKALPIDLPTTRRPVGIITLKNRTLSPAAQLFIDCAREIARPLAKRK